VLSLDPLPQEDVAKVLKKKAQTIDFPLHPKVEEFLLQTFTNSPKTLTRALEALILRHHIKLEQEKKPPAPITVQIAKYLLKDLIEKEQQGALTPEKIVQTVSEYFGIRQEDIFSKAQNRECVLPRQLAMYFCRIKLKIPYTQIGDHFSRDHSTVMSSIKLIKKGIDNNDKKLVGAYGWILKKLNK
ncbi:MAG: helix-turn-helix domain-containing protein, partial [Waddliaceae bacterium]